VRIDDIFFDKLSVTLRFDMSSFHGRRLGSSFYIGKVLMKLCIFAPKFRRYFNLDLSQI
jgi:hypothetical protein